MIAFHQRNKKSDRVLNQLEVMLRDIGNEVELTRHLIGKECLDKRVLAAVKTVERHRFVPRQMEVFAYDNSAVPIGHGQTISQPYIVALMTDILNPKSDDIVLEIGTGSGYQAAVLSLIVNQVYSIEIIEELATRASAHLRALNYTNIEVKTGDGYYGLPEHAPYDGIIVTAATPSVPQPLVDQLKPEGHLIIPIGLPHQHQELIVIEKRKSGETVSRSVLSVAFVPLTGRHDV